MQPARQQYFFLNCYSDIIEEKKGPHRFPNKTPIVGVHWAADCQMQWFNTLRSIDYNYTFFCQCQLKQETIGIIVNWDISTMPPHLFSQSLCPPKYVTLHMISWTCLHLQSKEIDFNTVTKHARAHFNEPTLLSYITH